MIGPFKRMYIKYSGWKYWMRFKQPAKIYSEHGCFDDTCNPDSNYGCKCNNFFKKRRQFTDIGYKKVAYYFSPFSNIITYVFSDGKNIALEKHTPGR